MSGNLKFKLTILPGPSPLTQHLTTLNPFSRTIYKIIIHLTLNQSSILSSLKRERNKMTHSSEIHCCRLSSDICSFFCIFESIHATRATGNHVTCKKQNNNYYKSSSKSFSSVKILLNNLPVGLAKAMMVLFFDTCRFNMTMSLYGIP